MNNDFTSATLSSSPHELPLPALTQGKSEPAAPESSEYTRHSENGLKRTSSSSQLNIGKGKGSKSSNERPLADIISEQFPAFDADSLIARPFEDEATRDAKSAEELSNMLLMVMLKTHAWAASRPKHEATLAGSRLEQEISQIIETEREQGMCSPTPSACLSSVSSSSFGVRVVEETRQRLGDFVQRMKNALAALMGIS